jgi:hypothetical protein
MKKVVSFSGGRTSAYLCHLMKEKYGDEVEFVYMDTGAEHPKTYEFIRRVNVELGLNLTCLRTNFDTPLGAGNGYHIIDIDDIGPDLKPFKEMMAKYGTPYIGGMFCTDRMKLVPYTKYCNDKYGKGNYETWLGIRSDEPSRLFNQGLARKMRVRGFPQRLFEDLLRWASEDNQLSRVRVSGMGVDDTLDEIKSSQKQGIRYLAELGEIEKQDVLDFWEEMPFNLGIDEWNGNCVFCPKKTDLKLAAAQGDNPEFYIDFLDAIGSDEVRKVVTRTQEFINSTAFYFYPKRFYKRSDEFIQKVTAYNEKRYELAALTASKKMYRGKKSLEQVIGMFEGSTGSEIKSRIRGDKMTDTGSCSESCEVFNCSL